MGVGIILMQHPDLVAENPDREPVEMDEVAFRDCWSQKGWVQVQPSEAPEAAAKAGLPVAATSSANPTVPSGKKEG